MIIENDTKLDFSDVLIKPKRSALQSRNDVDLIKRFKPKYGTEFEGVPIMAANMATGTFNMLQSFTPHRMFVAIAKHNNHMWLDAFEKDNTIINYGFYTIGMNDNEYNEFRTFYLSIIKLTDIYTARKVKLVIDIANGYTQKFSDFVKNVRFEFPHIVIIAGNVATPEMTEELIIAGADYVKIGIGPGSVCTTRRQTGIGYPQLSAAIECSDAAHGLGGGIVLDGGMRTPGDVAKAFCANADLVMMGGMFAGTDECLGDIIERTYRTGEMHWCDGEYKPMVIKKEYILFYGMSSAYAQEKHSSGMKKYRSSEGTTTEVPYVGPVYSIVMDMLGGLRSTGTYIGANSIKDFGKCATFVRVTHIHDKF